MEPTESAFSAVVIEIHGLVDALSLSEVSSTMNTSVGFCTPARSWSAPFCVSSCILECDLNKKPFVGMKFPNWEVVEEFYRTYADIVGFDVRVGQSRQVDGVMVWKRLYCSKEGYSSEKDQGKKIVDISK